MPAHRKHLRRRENDRDDRFITFSCYRRLPLLANPRIMDFFAESLAEARREHSFSLFAWVVMPEHVHLLLRPAEGSSWAAIALSLKTSTGSGVIGRWRQLRAPILARVTTPRGRARFWQHGGGFDRNVRNEAEFCKAVTYIHRNPVKRGLVADPRLWRWSSVRWWLGEREGELECDTPPGWERGLKLWRGFM